ncbi:hypothetical protein HMPREF1544_00122 [Mucor circinelloides 1006PhL]|uniref:Ndc10 domain-containing protein n=1 Tax=Mucor circinelloides f. circinelloides (strain 1006PhL) TaxID=1220926 RepID=S2KC19_MUCC1|nr:hypothetical protein HMPREF1544_00122 [Mucor circinelloides 1006PhL]KAG1091151.1 hypothetical protein G6F42_019503 [Rhizopus arrhizus]
MYHFCLLRGESARDAVLPELQVVNLEKEDSTRFCLALILVMRNEKTNKANRLDIGVCIKNVDFRICPFMITAMYLFSMPQIDCKPFPDFTSSKNWYFTKFLQTGNYSTTEWFYAAYHQAMEKALKACHIGSSKVTHMARGAGARRSSSYVTGLPRPAMGSFGGYETQQGTYVLFEKKGSRAT